MKIKIKIKREPFKIKKLAIKRTTTRQGITIGSINILK